MIELPDGVELREAAAMGIAGLTAWEVAHEVGRVSAEDRVLVLGASGGVGHMIVSLAGAAGATVWGQTGSPEKAADDRRAGSRARVRRGPGGAARARSMGLSRRSCSIRSGTAL